MTCLSREKYNELKDHAEKIARLKKYPDFQSWLAKFENDAYKSYLNNKCKSRNDLFKIAGLAYSWMPTMLEFHDEEHCDWDLLLYQIDQLDCWQH